MKKLLISIIKIPIFVLRSVNAALMRLPFSFIFVVAAYAFVFKTDFFDRVWIGTDGIIAYIGTACILSLAWGIIYTITKPPLIKNVYKRASAKTRGVLLRLICGAAMVLYVYSIKNLPVLIEYYVYFYGAELILNGLLIFIKARTMSQIQAAMAKYQQSQKSTSTSSAQSNKKSTSSASATQNKLNISQTEGIKITSNLTPDIINSFKKDFHGGKTSPVVQKQPAAQKATASNNKEAARANYEKKVMAYRQKIERRNMVDTMLKTIINSTSGCTYIEQAEAGRDSKNPDLDIPFYFLALKDDDKYVEIDALGVGEKGVFLIQSYYNSGKEIFSNTADGTVYVHFPDGDKLSLNNTALRLFKTKKALQKHLDSSVPIYLVFVLINENIKCETDDNANMHVVALKDLGSFMTGALSEVHLNEQQRTDVIKTIESLRLTEEEVNKIDKKN